MKADVPMPILDHLAELRRRVIWSLVGLVVASVAAFAFYDVIVRFLLRPFEGLDPAAGANTVYVTTVIEGFSTRIRVSLLCGVILSLPVHMASIVLFVFPGLTGRERRIVGSALVAGLLLVIGSATFGYAAVIPISIRFLMTSRFVPDGVGIILSLQRNIAYLFQFLLATLIVFEIPIVLALLMAFGVVSRRALLRASRYVIVGIAVLSAVLTPPDLISQVTLAVPLIALYFLTIGVAKVFGFGNE